MRKFAAISVLILGTAAVAMAGATINNPVTVPEIDAATGLAALTLVGSAVLIVRSRSKR